MFLATRAKAKQNTTNFARSEENESSKRKQPQGEYEFFTVDVDHPDRHVRIGKILPSHIKGVVQATVTEFRDIFLDYC